LLPYRFRANGPLFLVSLVAALFLAACGSSIASTSWPGLTAGDDNVVYVAYGPAVTAVDVAGKTALWSFPSASDGRLQFFAPPAIGEDEAIIGDFGLPGGMFSPQVTVSIYSLDLADADGRPPAANWTMSDLVRDRIIAAPLLVDDRVYVGTADNLVLALGAVDGRSLWPAPFEADNSIWGQPSYEDGMLYVGSLDSNLYALDAESGSEKWRASLGGAIASKAVLDDELIYVSSLDEQVYAVDKLTGDIRWSTPAEAAIWGAPVLVDGVLYYADLAGYVHAADAATGAPYWAEPVKLPGAIVAAPGVADGVIYIATAGDLALPEVERQGALYALAAADGREIWNAPAPQPVYTTPAVVDEGVVVVSRYNPAVPGQALLTVFAKEDGSQVWQYMPPVAS
jgi:outer membrane protein assembly factor BamB